MPVWQAAGSGASGRGKEMRENSKCPLQSAEECGKLEKRIGVRRTLLPGSRAFVEGVCAAQQRTPP